MKTLNHYLLLFHALLLSFVLSACQSEEAQTATNEPIDNTPKVVAWLTLPDASAANSHLFAGKVVAAEATRLSFESSGKIASITVTVGEAFGSGQILATLDKTAYELQLNQAKAQLSGARATLEQARRDVRRFRPLAQAGAIPAVQLENVRLKERSATEQVNALSAQVKLAQKQLNDTVLYAPFAGVVTKRFVEVNQLTSPQQPVFAVQANQNPEVTIAVPENLIQLLSLGQVVAVNLPSLPTPTPLMGKVSEISAQASLGAFPVKIQLGDNTHNALAQVKSGMTAEVRLQQSLHQQSFTIPPSALGAGANDSYYVYRIVAHGDDASKRLEKVAVTVLNLSGKSVQISGALQAGEQLVRSGVGFVQPSQAVVLMGEGVRRINP